ncbi:single-stranded DNA-binding protein [Schaalia vaccimaxillae]|uniref:single-stranded DNA-binding protein n=1 Tax=Schaalia vaccimaxillae TaxID=183916 RepID=UPI00040F06D0|nr:single-stranded DNA-binding protein [Schaalia vaccimaxillae]
MSDMTVTLRGRIGTDLRTYKTSTGRLIVRFRLAVPVWRVNDAGELIEDRTNWYTVRAWDRLAHNILRSVHKGQPVIVVGRPTASGWMDDKKEIRSQVIISAQSIGHDLSKGIAGFEKPVQPGQYASEDHEDRSQEMAPEDSSHDALDTPEVAQEPDATQGQSCPPDAHGLTDIAPDENLDVDEDNDDIEAEHTTSSSQKSQISGQGFASSPQPAFTY